MAGKKEEVVAAEYSELRAARPAEAVCPTFVLQADRPGHLRALIAAFRELPESEQNAAAGTLREFEMWEERCLRSL